MKQRKKQSITAFLTTGLTVAALSAALLSGCTQGTQSGAAQTGAPNGSVSQFAAAQAGSISVSGEGSVSVTPDIATLVFGVISEGEDASSVKNDNNKAYNEVVAFLKEEGFADESVKTSNLGMNPIYDWSGDVRQIAGYSMETDITLSDIPLDKLGDLIDRAVERGINSIQSVSYLCSDYDASYQEALKLAIENARSKAEIMAEAGGVSLGSVNGIFEYGADTQARYLSDQRTMNLAVTEDASAASMDLEPGQIEIKAQVTMDFLLQ